MSNFRKTHGFTSIRIEGGIFPPEFLQMIANREVEYQSEADYGISKSLNLKDELGRYWRIANDLYGTYKELSIRSEIEPVKVGVDDWLIPLFRDVLGYNDIHTTRAVVIGDRQFPITHYANDRAVPLVLTHRAYDLDRADIRFGMEGRRRSPHGLLQEFLNATNTCLWGILSNGTKVRLLRDNPSLTRPAYVEVDLELMFEEQLYSDFVAFWLIFHATRFKPRSNDPLTSIIESWRYTAHETGQRALDDLRHSVTEALRQLGNGFLEHPENESLRTALAEGSITSHEYFQELLRLVYRLLFLFSVEERNLLHPSEATKDQRTIYQEGYSLSRLRDRALLRRSYDRYGDLWEGLQIVFRGLRYGAEPLGLPALGGIFSEQQCPMLDEAKLSNKYLLSAIYSLSYINTRNGLVRINYRDMDTEELGAVYEGLLELYPYINVDTRPWTFGFVGDLEAGATRGSERKLTGSYYTPSSLVNELIKSALEPVMSEAVAKRPENPKAALLELKIIDPACGSGHFLLASARRMAAEIAKFESGEDTPDELTRQHALREVVQRCIYGVDRNPLAVELCKTALWIEAIEPGKPLTFLDSHIQCGDSLIGVLDPKILDDGIPNDAYSALTGDDQVVCRELKKQNRKSGSSVEGDLFEPEGLQEVNFSIESFEDMPEDTIAEVEAKRKAWLEATSNFTRKRQELLANLYVAAFFTAKTLDNAEFVPVTEDLDRVRLGVVSRKGLEEKVTEIAKKQRFFHWYLEFPDIMKRGGFDVILGNPPWERIKLQEQEFFANRSPEIAQAPNKSAREKLIKALTRPGATPAEAALYKEFEKVKHDSEAASQFIHKSKRYPLTGIGDVNTYALFAETILNLLSLKGRAGIIVPTGIATDNSTKAFFEEISTKGRLVSLYDFENREALFPSVDSRQKFCLITLGSNVSETEYVFFATNVDQLQEKERRFTLSSKDILLINPNTKTCPIFRSNADAKLTKKIYSRVPVLIDENKGDSGNPWGINFMTMFHMSNDSGLFKTYAQLENDGAHRDGVNWIDIHGEKWIPLYEAKMIHHYDHRWATFDVNEEEFRDTEETEKRNFQFETLPRYWVKQTDVEHKLAEKDWTREWLIGFRNITNVTNERTFIATVIPKVGVGHSMPLILFNRKTSAQLASVFLANLSSLCFDYIVRQKVGGTNMTYHYIYQFPIFSPEKYSETELKFIVPRILELTYTSEDMRPFANNLGFSGSPFKWDSDRRAILRAELDAYYAYLYGFTREELNYILDPTNVYGEDYPSETFRVLKENEIRRFGEYRTQRLILEAWDRLVREGFIHPTS